MSAQTENKVCDGYLRKQAGKPLSVMQLQRIRLGLTQKRLADICGISHQTVEAVEAGRQVQVGLQTASKIARVLGVRADELLQDLRNAEIVIHPEMAESSK